MLHATRQALVLLACAAVLGLLTNLVNYSLAPWALTIAAPGLLVAFAALRLPFGAGFTAAFLAGLWLDAASPVPFGRHAFLLALCFCLLHRVRPRLPREAVIVGVVAALFINLALFVLLALFALANLPDPATGGLRLLADLFVSQLFTALVGPWFLAFQSATLRLAGAAPAQSSSPRYA
jgi:rod shape-determining protein MreD